MIQTVTTIPLNETFCCTELPDKQILVTGNKFIKVFSLETYQEMKNIPSKKTNYDSLMIADQKLIFVVTSCGLERYSYPDFLLVKVHYSKLSVRCFCYLKSKNKLLFNGDDDLFCFNLQTSTFFKFTSSDFNKIQRIASSSDEDFIFSIGLNRHLVKSTTDSFKKDKSVELFGGGTALLIKEDTGSIFVGTNSGKISEYSISDLSLIRTSRILGCWISKIIRLSSGDIMTCSENGFIFLPFKSDIPIINREGNKHSLTQLSDKTIACCDDKGVKILFLLDQDCSIMTTVESLSSNIESIRNSSSAKKPQLISLLQHHLIQLMTPVKHQPENFTGLTISLSPDLKYIQKSHCFEGSAEGRKQILTQKYFLEIESSKSLIPDSKAVLTLFDRKQKFEGKITNVKNPVDGFLIEKIRKSKWVLSMINEIRLGKNLVYGLATVKFLNGYLNCYALEGDVIIVSKFQSTLKVDGIVKKVSSIGYDGLVVTSDRKIYSLNFNTNTIEDFLKN